MILDLAFSSLWLPFQLPRTIRIFTWWCGNFERELKSCAVRTDWLELLSTIANSTSVYLQPSYHTNGGEWHVPAPLVVGTGEPRSPVSRVEDSDTRNLGTAGGFERKHPRETIREHLKLGRRIRLLCIVFKACDIARGEATRGGGTLVGGTLVGLAV